VRFKIKKDGSVLESDLRSNQIEQCEGVNDLESELDRFHGKIESNQQLKKKGIYRWGFGKKKESDGQDK
jgi:hypothetical protein